MDWLRLHTDLIDDPKMARLSDKEFRIFIFLLCFARESSADGTIKGELPDLAWRIRIDETAIKTCIDALVKLKVVTHKNSCISFVNWQKRQPLSDSSAERVKRYRKKQCNVTETLPKRPSNVIEQNRTDTEQNRTDTDAETLHDTQKIFDLISSEIPEAEGSNQITEPMLFDKLDSFLQSYPTFQNLTIWQQYLGKIKQSDFLMGRGDEVKQPPLSVSWIVRPENAMDVMDGKYKNRPKRRAGNVILV
jgi:hypothetical protein